MMPRLKPPLDIRLSALYPFLLPGLPLWDIGADHGNLSFLALTEGLVSEIKLVDRSKLVMENLALKKKSKIGLEEKIHLIHTDGEKLKGIQGSIIISGMGGLAIANIVEAILPHIARPYRLLLCPEKNSFELRQKLAKSKLKVISEKVVGSKNYFREILICADQGDEIDPWGKKLWVQNKCFSPYFEHLFKYASLYKDKSPKMEELFNQLTQVSQEYLT